jgi:hypothetical protein
LGSKSLLQQLAVGRYHAQGLLEIVRSRVGELLQIAVGAFERRVRGLQGFLLAHEFGDVTRYFWSADNTAIGVLPPGY